MADDPAVGPHGEILIPAPDQMRKEDGFVIKEWGKNRGPKAPDLLKEYRRLSWEKRRREQHQRKSEENGGAA